VFIEAKDDGGGGDNWSYKSCKAPSVKSSSPSNQHPVFIQAGCPSCRPTNSVKALKGRTIVTMEHQHEVIGGVSNSVIFNLQWPLTTVLRSRYF